MWVSEFFSTSRSSSSGRSPNLGLDRGRFVNSTEVGVPMPGASRQAIHASHARVVLGVLAAVVLFGLSLLGPGVPLVVVAAASIWAAVMDHRTLRIPNRLVLVCMVIVVIGAAALWLIGPRSSSQIALAVVAGILLGRRPDSVLALARET